MVGLFCKKLWRGEEEGEEEQEIKNKVVEPHPALSRMSPRPIVLLASLTSFKKNYFKNSFILCKEIYIGEGDLFLIGSNVQCKQEFCGNWTAGAFRGEAQWGLAVYIKQNIRSRRNRAAHL